MSAGLLSIVVTLVSDPLGWIGDYADQRRAQGLRRAVRPRETVGPIDLASNDYLGLVRDPRVVEGAIEALRQWGAGSTGSRLVTGSTRLHAQFEEDLADYMRAPAALVFSSGYTANLGAVTALTGAGSLIVSDAHSHASLVDACRLSRSRIVVTPHNDVTAVAEALAQRTESRALVVTDSVFSADGDLADLRALHAVCREHGATLLVDEAHGLGVRGGGRGLVVEAGLADEPDIVRTVTLSKSLASLGGAVLATTALRDHLIDAARTFIFDTGLAPANLGAASAALAILREQTDLPATVLGNARRLAGLAGLTDVPESAVVSVVLGEAEVAAAAATRALELGVHVGCFRPPSVPHGTSRLRLTARANLTEPEFAAIGDVLAQVLT